MVYMGSEVVQFIEGQMLGRVFLELGVRGGRMLSINHLYGVRGVANC
jgi:hypothetical protein